ncbi:hypothetical protein MNBD_ALPHA09-1638 [hydrothermal vent metagenome]|uniref:DUF2336 domain-containing protein n=1 Tax=hydrothermal vent metagenome TaxID=652676 RepID=A0A3B0T6F0_9ZZZZ
MSISVEQMQDIARIRDSKGRRELLGAVADLFLAGETVKSTRESALFSDIFLKTIEDLDADGQVEVSNQLAGSVATPKDVAVHLARVEDVSVADPILRLSPVLDETDLIEIASEMSNDHLVSISQRKRLSETVTDVLIDRGDNAVKRHVSANDGAQISRGGFETLAHSARNDDVLGGNLAERLDVPEEILARVLPKLSGDVAQRVKRAFASAVDKQAVGNAVAQAEKVFAGAKLESSRARVASLVFAKDVTEGKRNIDDVVRDFTAEDKFLELVTILARLVDLPDTLVGDLMFKAENAPFIIMCRSIGMSRAAFADFSDLRCRRLKLPSSHGAHAMSEFDVITEDMANRFVRFVNLRMTL